MRRTADDPAVSLPDLPAPAGRSRRAARTDWRLGGRTVRRWREELLGWALCGIGAGLILGTLLPHVWASPAAAVLGDVLIWLGMLVPVVRAFRLSVPVGLLRLRGTDILFGLALGLLLRLVQGWLAIAVGGGSAFPGYPLLDGRLAAGWWFTDLVAVVGISPVLEELAFRGVVLVALYTLLRRPLGRATAGLVAVIVSSGLFLLVHGWTGMSAPDAVAAVAVLGLVCGALVVLTGRIWGAVAVHVVFNASYVVLALVGTFLA